MSRSVAIPAILSVVLVLGATSVVVAQRGFGGRGRFHVDPNIPYDGRFTFVRVNYESNP